MPDKTHPSVNVWTQAHLKANRFCEQCSILINRATILKLKRYLKIQINKDINITLYFENIKKITNLNILKAIKI